MTGIKKFSIMLVFVIAIFLVATSFLVALVLVPSGAATRVTDDYGDKLGTVHFSVSCNERAQQLPVRPTRIAPLPTGARP
jgi:hypothetical protein